MSRKYARPLAMTVLALALAAGTAGCQTMADLDPTGLLGDDSPAPDSQFPTESNQQAQVIATTTTPDLSSISSPAASAPDASCPGQYHPASHGSRHPGSVQRRRLARGNRCRRAAAGCHRCQCHQTGAGHRRVCTAHGQRCPAIGKRRAADRQRCAADRQFGARSTAYGCRRCSCAARGWRPAGSRSREGGFRGPTARGASSDINAIRAAGPEHARAQRRAERAVGPTSA